MISSKSYYFLYKENYSLLLNKKKKKTFGASTLKNKDGG